MYSKASLSLKKEVTLIKNSFDNASISSGEDFKNTHNPQLHPALPQAPI